MMSRARRRDVAGMPQAAAAEHDVRLLAVCADDFGLDPKVNASALDLASRGRLSAIGCMVGAPFWRGGALALRTLDSAKTDTGLHLDLTQHPLHADVRRSLPEWILRSHSGTLDTRRLRLEIGAQLDAFVGEMQRPPAFVDGHEHVHQLPGVRDVLLEVLAARGFRPWLRSTRRPAGWVPLKARLIEALGAAGLERKAQAHGLRQNRRLLGVYAFDSDAATYLQSMRHWLALVADGDLLICHPAAGRCDFAPHAAARCREYELLAGTGFATMLAEARLQIAPLWSPRSSVPAPASS
jgi:predicted glycoside hydrolase/deacetylase ChbG (UPF0249 family)